MTTYCILMEKYNYGVHYRTLIWRTPHRHIRDESLYASTGSFLYILRRGDENPDRGSTTGAASWTDRARSKRAAPTKTPGAFLNNACVGPAGRGPGMGRVTASEASQSPLTAIFEMRACAQVRAFFFACGTRRGDESPDRGSTSGNATRTERKDKPNDTFSLRVTGAC